MSRPVDPTEEQKFLLIQAERFIRDYHRGLLAHYGDIQTSTISESEHPLVTLMVNEMTDWIRRYDTLSDLPASKDTE